MEVIYKKVNELKPYERNARTHSKEQVDQIVKSIQEYGFTNPLLIDENNNIIAGHGRLEASKKLNYIEVPCIVLKGLTEAQKRAYIIADNKMALNAGWNDELLKLELEDLKALDFDLELTGFTTDELNDLLKSDEDIEIVEDEAPEPPKEPKSKLGDIYQLGNHRLMCGDSTKIEDVEKLMNGNKADLFLTDPPYNVNYTDGRSTERKIMNDAFDSDEECGKKLWLPAFKNARENCEDCCSVYCFMPQGGTHMMMMMMMMTAGWQVKHELIWEKQSIVLNRADYNYQHEPILYGWNKNHKFYGKGQFKNTSIWKFDRPTKSKEHPTMKPIALLSEILLNATKQNDKVIDLFGGSGSTLIACEQLNRNCYMMELDPKYIDVIIERWESLTGKKAIKVKE